MKPLLVTYLNLATGILALPPNSQDEAGNNGIFELCGDQDRMELSGKKV